MRSMQTCKSACDVRPAAICCSWNLLEHQLRLLGDALGVDLAFDQYNERRLAFNKFVS